MNAGYMLDALDRWEAFAGEAGKQARLFPVPPCPNFIALHLFLLDAAQDFITTPSLQHRLTQEQKAGGNTSLFGWGK